MESSGKTALCLHLIGCAQRAGGKGGIVDVENALNISHARQVGVNVEELLLSQPDGGEEAMALVLRLLKSKAVDVLVVDSVAQLQPMKEQEKGIEGSTMGGQAQLMSKSMRFVKREALRSGTLLIFINQIRYKIGVVFGNPETTPGGMALRFAADIRIAMRAKGPYKNKGKILGFESRLRIVKNKVGIPFTNARLRLRYGEGWRSLKPIDEKDEK
jgi:recombination protein RecA